MTDEEAQEPLPGPEFEVWNHLESGLQQAHDDMAHQVGAKSMKVFEALASGVVELKLGLFVAPGGPPLSGPLSKLAPQLSLADQADLLSTITANYPDINPWLKHSIELAIATIGITRATTALERFGSLVTSDLAKPVPQKVLPYVRELVHTYLFGFDAAAVVLARSTFELLGKAVLVRKGIMTEPYANGGKVMASTILVELKRGGFLTTTHDTAQRLVTRGNTVAHRALYDEKIAHTVALDSIKDLVAVARELAEHL